MNRGKMETIKDAIEKHIEDGNESVYVPNILMVKILESLLEGTFVPLKQRLKPSIKKKFKKR